MVRVISVFFGLTHIKIIKTIISFFPSVSFPRTRWQANCVFRSTATRKRNETLCLWLGKRRACEAIGARVRTQVRILKSCILCQILHSPPYFFILVFSTAFYHRSRMTGRYLLPKKRNSLLPSFLSGEQNRNDDRRKNRLS